MAKKTKHHTNLPRVSKQTAGGVTGAVIGGMVAGPVGAVAGGVAGAMVGNSSARGDEPVKKAIETVRLAGRRGATAIKAARDRNKALRTEKKPTTGSVAKKSQAKVALTSKAKRAARQAKKKG